MNRLKELLDEYNLKQIDIELELGISKHIIFNILNERSTIDNTKISIFCDYFNVSADYFLGRSNEGIYVNVLGRKCSLSKEKFLLYKSMGKIKYEDNKKRTLDINSLDEIKFVISKVPSIELIDEF